MPDTADRAARRYRKTIVTEEALHVSPDVLGLTLARPWRRLCAILLDTVLVSILAREFGVFFGFAAAYVLFRVSFRPTPSGGFLKRSFRFMFRMGGAVMLFVAVVVLWGEIRDRFEGFGDDEGDRSVSASINVGDDDAPGQTLNMSPLEGVRFGTDMVSLTTADDEEAARAAAAALLESMRGAGMSGSDAREAIRELAGGLEGRPWLLAAVEPVLQADAADDPGAAPAAEEEGASEPADSVPEDSLFVVYAAAVSAGDSAAAASLRPRVVGLLAADTVAALDEDIAGLREEVTELDEDRDQLRERVEELEEEMEEGPGFLGYLRAVAEDLGIGLGWFGLYFTATTALWQGRTPGKRLFGIRVISLTGKPIGWWAAFERFGGYAAGFATGLLGFAQVLWDDNRQAIHDKIAATAVIRDRRSPSA